MKLVIPDTRHSLILRLSNRRDIEAWERFVEVYQPLVYRLARARGFQDADAQEVVQEVLMAVSRSVERWAPDPHRGRFRDWLFRIARNLMINFLTRKKHRPIDSGDLSLMIEQHIDPSCREAAAFDLEYRREVFRWAADRVRSQVRERTWLAFQRTHLAGQSVSQIAAELEMTVGAVHIARSRVLGRLREAVKHFENDDESTAAERGES